MEIRAFRWYGGKIRMVHKITPLIPEHTAYYEPFMGSASLLLNHSRSQLEVINDLDSDLVHFMKTLADAEKGKVLTEKLYNLWYDQWQFKEAMEYKRKHYKGLNDVDKAVMIYVLISQSFNNTRKSFSKKAFKDTFTYRQDILFNIPKVHDRLKGVHILNMNGIDLLARISKNGNAFAFVDPPYRSELRGVGADKAYACELPHKEQVRLLKTIRYAKCKIMLCGYKTEKGADLYDTYLLPHGWKYYKLDDYVKASQCSKKHRDMGHEYIWVNYELPSVAKYFINTKAC